MDVLTVVLFVAGLALLILGAELLVRGAAGLATAAGISPLVIGLTVVAFATSSPELAVGILASLGGQSGITLGNVLGSNIANVLLILGLAAITSPLAVSSQLIRLHVPVMIGLSILLFMLAFDGAIDRLEGILLVAIAVGYTAFTVYEARKERQANGEPYASRFGEQAGGGNRRTGRQLLLVGGGLALLVLGSRWLVQGAVTLAGLFGVSELIIGLTIVAVGTSLPEIAASLIASYRGEQDMVVGNVVGSNIFNIVGVLGLVAVIVPGGIIVPPAVQLFDLPLVIAVALVTLPIFFSGCEVSRGEGVLFLGYYLIYVLYLMLTAQHENLPALSRIVPIFVVPLVIVSIGLVAAHLHRQRAAREADSVRPE